MTYVVLDSFPGLLVARRIGIADAAAVAGMLARVDVHLDSTPQQLALVYDAGDNPEGQPDAKARQVGGDWFKRRRADLKRACVGFDFAVHSSVSRGALTAVFWIAKPPVPYAIASSTLGAVTNAIGRMGSRGNVAPEDVVAALEVLARSG